MIQKTGSRHASTSVTSSRPGPSSSGDVQEQHWGSWASNGKHYSLEVIQHPIRARMCGFGDKDRRPLAPAAVAKMTVRREDNSIVDVDDIDVAFFVVTVDLWSADGKQEMNLVLHPSSADRYVPAQISKPTSSKRRGNTSSSTPQRHDQPSSSHSGNTPMSTPGSNYPSQGYPLSAQPPGMSETMPFGPHPPPYPQHPEQPMGWGYQHPMPAHPHAPGVSLTPNSSLPSISAYHRSREDGNVSAYRGWSSDAFSHVDPSSGGSSTHGGETYGHRPYPPDAYNSSASTPSLDMYGQPYVSPSHPHGHASQSGHPQHPPHQHPQHAPFTAPNSPASSSLPQPRHSYTRTLVGPLSANACRLNDEHRKPGIFFLFQDLSIRTEGTFRLRLRLMNVGAHPAPDPGSKRVMTDKAPILAQTFTEPFTVFSAKRFPGVPDTTALSIAFGNQGQKLPLRNRHGSRPSGRRRHHGSDGSDNESDS